MGLWTIEFKKPYSKQWKVVEVGDFKYKNVDKSVLNEVVPEAYDEAPKGYTLRIKRGKKIVKVVKR